MTFTKHIKKPLFEVEGYAEPLQMVQGVQMFDPGHMQDVAKEMVKEMQSAWPWKDMPQEQGVQVPDAMVIDPHDPKSWPEPKQFPLGLAFSIMTAHGLLIKEMEVAHQGSASSFPTVNVTIQLHVVGKSSEAAISLAQLQDWVSSNGKKW